MKSLKKIVVTLAISALLVVSAASFAAPTNASSDQLPTQYTAYNFSTTANANNNKWYQTGKITFTNLSTESLENWVYTFDSNVKIKTLQNVNYTVAPLHNGQFRYTVKPANWEKYVASSTWTHKNAILPGKTVTFAISGDSNTDISSIKLTNCVLSDDQKQPMTVNAWQLKGVYQVKDVISYKGTFYKCRQAHRADAANWTPNLTPALWAKLQKSPYTIVESTK